jgi:hypothetical protein
VAKGFNYRQFLYVVRSSYLWASVLSVERQKGSTTGHCHIQFILMPLSWRYTYILSLIDVILYVTVTSEDSDLQQRPTLWPWLREREENNSRVEMSQGNI